MSLTFVKVSAQNALLAGEVHARSWRASHREICSEAFIAQHTAKRQAGYLLAEIEAGKQVYMLLDGNPVGVVSVKDRLIENLYVLPECWRRGYGSALLAFAETLCTGAPTLWILSGNTGARSLYEKHGYMLTGRIYQLNEALCEMEMKKEIR